MDRSWEGSLIRGGAVAAEDGVHIAWEAYELPDDPVDEYDLETELVTTHIGKNGALLGERRRRILPSRRGSGYRGIYAMGFMLDGRFNAAHGWTDLSLASGLLTDAELTDIPLDDIDESVMGVPTHVAWDGEAYLIELGNLDGQWAMRRSATGEPLLAPTRYGSLSSRSYTGYDLGYKTSTNSVSGVTYAFAASSTRWLTGHSRDGQRLPWIPETGSLQLPPVDGDGVLPMSGANAPAVATDADGGAWIVWSQSTTKVRMTAGVQHVSMDGTLSPVLWFNSPPEDATDPRRFAVYADGPERVYIAAATAAAIHMYEVTDQTIAAPKLLVEVNPSDNGVTRDFREMHLVSDGDDTLWLVMQTNVYTRVLKVAPGCVYPMEPSPAE